MQRVQLLVPVLGVMRILLSASMERRQRLKPVDEVLKRFPLEPAVQGREADRAEAETCFDEHEVDTSGRHDYDTSAQSYEARTESSQSSSELFEYSAEHC